MFPRYILLFALGFAFYTTSECKSLIDSSEPVNLIENNRPIIGVLSQEISAITKKNFPGDYASYIAASYIKFVEGAGARAVPLWIGQSRDYYEDIMKKINGVLFPGGATFFNNSNGYADAGRHIYQIALEMNQNGVYMPVWGTCLGFELMLYVANKDREHRTSCNSLGQVIPLDFVTNIGRDNGRLFSGASSDLIKILSTDNVTYNWHQYCTTNETFISLGLDTDWRILSTDKDFNGLEFISSVEHKTYPFYGIQFHPEKNPYEWVSKGVYPHSEKAIYASQYFANFFVSESRKNANKFPTEAEELDSLIQNYSPVFTGKGKSSYFQLYFFGPNASYGSNLGILANSV